MRGHSVPVVESGRLIAVEPAGHVQRGDVHLLEVIRPKVDRLPVRVQVAILHELAEQRHPPTERLVHREERAVRVNLRPIETPLVIGLLDSGRDVIGPRERPAHQERAALVIEHAVEARRGGRDDAYEMRRPLPGCQPLYRAQVRHPHHAYPTVRPRLIRQPFHAVVPVRAIRKEKLERALGVASSPDVLHGQDVAPAGEVQPELGELKQLHRLEIRSAHQDDRMRSRLLRQPEIG